MKPRTLRRKLQKKLKHKPYYKCPKCGKRMDCSLIEGDHDGWHLWTYCGELFFAHNYVSVANARGRLVKYVNGKTYGCSYFRKLLWSGGGTGRHIPHVPDSSGNKC